MSRSNQGLLPSGVRTHGTRSRNGQRANGSTRPRRQDSGATTLTVWLYDSTMGAASGQVRLKDLQQRGAVVVLDALTVTWTPGTHAPRIGHLRHQTSAAARNSVLGALVGALVPPSTVGGLPGPGTVALAEQLRGSGIDRQFLEEMKDHLMPGTSALLVLSTDTDLDAVRPVIERGRARGDVVLMHASLPECAPDTLFNLLDATRCTPRGHPA